jgi:FkbM family methyltransferase
MTFKTLFELAKLTFVDCGASYFPPDTWQPALGQPDTHLILVDPNGQNLGYGSKLACKTETIPKALWSEPGIQTLYIANTDSGSSLLAPTGRPDVLEADNGYFFPLTARSIYCSSLSAELDSINTRFVDSIKLDTQGSELEILKGLDRGRMERLMFIEAEVSLQSPTIYQGAATLRDFSDYLEPQGYELANIRLSRSCHSLPHALSRPNECDILYVRPLHRLGDLAKDPHVLIKIIALANLYYLYDYSDQIIKYISDAGISLPWKIKDIVYSQNLLRDLQGDYLARGGLSLWHRDGG